MSGRRADAGERRRSWRWWAAIAAGLALLLASLTAAAIRLWL
ncbi:MAG TPA: hypothetical protein VFV71_01105 [Burkholderiales bacterium]|nr:hypothetical protein [Burkholderiales bacterium]